MKNKLWMIVTALTLAAVCFTGCGGRGKDGEALTAGSTSAERKLTGTVSTDGSTSMEKVVGALGESFTEQNTDVKFSYNPTGSGSGIAAVINETCDIGLSSRHLKGDEKAQGLKEIVLAYDGIVVIVNSDNSVTDLTLQQIADIYTGKVTNWSELGGDDREIVVIGREAGSGTRDGFESVTGTVGECVLRQELTSTGDVIATVKGNENAIGYASLASVSDTVSVISVDGVAPSAQTVLDGSYAIQRPFVFVVKEGMGLSDVAQAFMDYCFTDEAKDVISAAGVVPVE